MTKEVIIGKDGRIVGDKEHDADKEENVRQDGTASTGGGIGMRQGVQHDLSEVFLDIIELSQEPTSAMSIPRVVYTKQGESGYWNRDIAKDCRHLLFVYGENHRDYLAMGAYLHPVSGRFESDRGPRGYTSHEGIHIQETTQAN